MASPQPVRKTPSRIARSAGQVSPRFKDLWRGLRALFVADNSPAFLTNRVADYPFSLTPVAAPSIRPSRFGKVLSLEDTSASTPPEHYEATTPDFLRLGWPVTFGYLIRFDLVQDSDFAHHWGAHWDDSDTKPFNAYKAGQDRNGNIVMEWNNGGNRVNFDTGVDQPTLVDGNWHVFVCRITPTEGDFFLDGEPAATSVRSNVDPTYDPTSQLTIGPLYGGRWLPAKLDNLFISARRWTDGEIKQFSQDPNGLYRVQSPGVFAPVPATVADGALTDGGETVAAEASVVPSADGSLTDGGEGVGGAARVEPFAAGAVADAGETITATASVVPSADGAVSDGPETVAGEAGTVVEVSGSATDGGETVAGDVAARVLASGSLTDAGEVVAGDVDTYPILDGAVVDGGEMVAGVASSPVGSEKALVRNERTGAVVAFTKGSLNVTTRMNACDSATFSVFLRPGESRPLDVGEPVNVYRDEALEEKVWAGTVDRYKETDLVGAANYTRRVSYDCVCFSALADRYHVSASYRGEVAGDIVRTFIEEFLQPEGVSAGVIQDGPVLSKANFSYTPLSKALNDLGDETGFGWFIDEEKRLHFRSRASTLGILEINAGNRPFRTFEIERGRKQYRNRQIVRGGKGETAERTESFVGDGEQKTFTLAFPVSRKPTIEVNGVEQTVGIGGLDDDTAWTWNKASNTITQAEGETALGAADLLEVTYIGQVPIAVEASDNDQIEDRADVEGGQGIYEDVVTESSIDEQDAALERAEALLRRFGRIDERVRFDLNTEKVRQGQLIEINLPDRGIVGEYLLSEVNFKVRDDDKLVASVEAISGEPYGGWTKFFRELQQAKQEFTVRENEEVLLQLRVDDEVSAGDSVAGEEGAAEAFIVGADGDPVGGGDSTIGFVRVGDTEHEEGIAAETLTLAETTNTTTDSDLTTTIGSDEIGFTTIG